MEEDIEAEQSNNDKTDKIDDGVDIFKDVTEDDSSSVGVGEFQNEIFECDSVLMLLLSRY